jgi:hypothetical protein
VKDLRETKELCQEIVTLTVGKREPEGEWFTLAGAKLLLGIVPYRMTRRERAELLDASTRLEKPKAAGGAGIGAGVEAGAKPGAPEVVKLMDGQESVITLRQEEGKDEDGDGWLEGPIFFLRYERRKISATRSASPKP